MNPKKISPNRSISLTISELKNIKNSLKNIRNTRIKKILRKQNKTNEEQVIPDFTENHVTRNNNSLIIH